jgi:hypothetical protein
MWKKVAFIAYWAVQLVLCVPAAHAVVPACTISGGVNFAPDVPSNVFPRDAPAGTQSAPYSTLVTLTCPPDTTDYKTSIYTLSPTAVAVTGFTNYYQTDVPDIAVRYTAENAPGTSCSAYSGGMPSQILIINRTLNCNVAATGQSQTFTLKYTAYFMKVGNAPVGKLTTIPAVTIQEYSPATSTTVNVFSGLATGRFTVAACTVTTPAIAVTMPKTYTYRLPKVGSTDGETSLNIGLNCDPGVKVYTTLTDVSAPSNTSTTLSLSPDSTAQGIGYQILYNATPVKFGVDSSVPGNPGQFVLTPAQTTGGVLSVPLTARYIRTGKIGTGSVNGKATFTMSYQ